jgi:hypothetical protein
MAVQGQAKSMLKAAWEGGAQAERQIVAQGRWTAAGGLGARHAAVYGPASKVFRLPSH